MPRANVGDIDLHYQQMGAGRDVVLIHALTSNLAIWYLTNTMTTLARDFRVTAYDLRGHGMSDLTNDGYTSEVMADDLLRLHRKLGLEPVLLVGHSFGGLVALHAAATYPDVIAGVVMSDAYIPALADLDAENEEDGLWLDLRRIMAHAGKEIGPRQNFQRLFDTAAELTPQQADAVTDKVGIPLGGWLEQLARLAPTAASREAFEVAGLTRERIAAIAQPVVAMYDERTEFPGACRFLLSHLKNSRRVALPVARHLAPLETSEAFVQSVHVALRELAAQPGFEQVNVGQG